VKPCRPVVRKSTRRAPGPLGATLVVMERHPTTAVLLCCKACGLIRVLENYAAAHARGKAHTSLSGHPHIKYSLIQAPDRLKDVQAHEKDSTKRVKGYVEDD
jgi:hypothetical protein